MAVHDISHSHSLRRFGHDRRLPLYRQLWTLQFHLLSQYKSALQSKGRVDDKYPDVLLFHAPCSSSMLQQAGKP